MSPKLSLPATPSTDHYWKIKTIEPSESLPPELTHRLSVTLEHYGVTVWRTSIPLDRDYHDFLGDPDDYQDLLDIIEEKVTKDYETYRTGIENEYHLFSAHSGKHSINIRVL